MDDLCITHAHVRENFEERGEDYHDDIRHGPFTLPLLFYGTPRDRNMSNYI